MPCENSSDCEIRQTVRHLKLRCCRARTVPRIFKTHIVDILHAGHVHVFFEETHEVVFTEIAKPGKLCNLDAFGIMHFDVIEHIFELIGGCVDTEISIFFHCIAAIEILPEAEMPLEPAHSRIPDGSIDLLCA